MTTSATDLNSALVREVRVAAELLIVDLRDGRSLSVPLSWYPRLAAGTPAEQSRWRLIGGGHGIHWPDLDEDLSVAGWNDYGCNKAVMDEPGAHREQQQPPPPMRGVSASWLGKGSSHHRDP